MKICYVLEVDIVINTFHKRHHTLASERCLPIYTLAFIAPSIPRDEEGRRGYSGGVLGLRIIDVPSDDRKTEMGARGGGSNNGGASRYHGLCW